jgi:hypothetical protein
MKFFYHFSYFPLVIKYAILYTLVCEWRDDEAAPEALRQIPGLLKKADLARMSTVPYHEGKYGGKRQSGEEAREDA